MKALPIIILTFLMILPVCGTTRNEAVEYFNAKYVLVNQELNSVSNKVERSNQLGRERLDEKVALFNQIAEHYKTAANYCERALKKVKKAHVKEAEKNAKRDLTFFRNKENEFRGHVKSTQDTIRHNGVIDSFNYIYKYVEDEINSVGNKIEKINQLGKGNLDEKVELFNEIAEHYKRAADHCNKALDKVKEANIKEAINSAQKDFDSFRRKEGEFREHAKQTGGVIQHNEAIDFFNKEYEKLNAVYSLGIEKNNLLHSGSITDKVEHARLLEEIANLFEAALSHCQNALNRVIVVGATNAIDTATKDLVSIRERAEKVRRECNQFIGEVREKSNNIVNKINEIEPRVLSLIQKGDFLEIKELILLYGEIIPYKKILKEDTRANTYSNLQQLYTADKLEFEANQILKLLSEKNYNNDQIFKLKQRLKVIDLFEQAVKLRQGIIEAFLHQRERINQINEVINEQKRVIAINFKEAEFGNELDILLQHLSSIANDKLAQLDLLAQINRHVMEVKAYYEIIGKEESALIWDYWVHFSNGIIINLETDICFDLAERFLNDNDIKEAVTQFQIGKKKLLSGREELATCTAIEQKKDHKLIQEQISAVELRFSRLSQIFDEHISRVVSEIEKDNYKRFYRYESMHPKARIGEFTRGVSFVKPLSGQKGIELLKFGTHHNIYYKEFDKKHWFDCIEKTKRKHDLPPIGKELFDNPIAAFGEAIGGSALYVGQTYQFAISSGELFWIEEEDPDNFKNISLLIKVYRKKDFSDESINVKPVYEEAIILPKKPGRFPWKISSDSIVNNLWGEKFLNQAGSLFIVKGKLKEEYDLDVKIRYTGYGKAWHFKHDSPLIISHKALSDNYHYIIEMKGYYNDKGQLEPVVICDENQDFQNKKDFLKTFSSLYALSFSPKPPFSAEFAARPKFNGMLRPSHYVYELDENLSASTQKGVTSEFIKKAQFPNIDYFETFKSKEYNEKNYRKNVESRKHECLNEVIEKYGHSAVSLAEFVQNEIELIDGLSWPRAKNVSLSEKKIYPGIITRGALGTLLEKQGSPWEQCVLLVHLLREAGYIAGYAEIDKGSMVMDQERLSKMIRMQLKDYKDDYKGYVLNFPWVVFYDEEAKEWRHIFPWIKDIEIIEGSDIYDFMPPGYENAQKWIRKYLENDPAILKHIGMDDNDTAGVLFEKFLKEQLNIRAIDIDDVGVRYGYRKHKYNGWDEFPVPVEIKGSIKVSDSLKDRDELFTKLRASIFSANNPGKKIETQWMRMAEIHNRPFYTYFEPISNNPEETHYWLTLKMKEFSNQYGGTQGDFSESYLQGEQINRVEIDESDRNIKIKVEYDGRSDGFFSNYLDVVTKDGIYEITRPIDRGSIASICVTYGRVTPEMVKLHANQFSKIKASASIYDVQGLLTYMTGVSYFERLSRAEEFLRRMHKLPIFPVYGFGLSKLSPDLTSKSSNISAKGDLIGQPILRYPQVDMMFHEFNGIANDALHPEYGHNSIANTIDYHLLSITDGSSNEHQVLNDVFGDSHAISTVKLLQLAHKRHHDRGGQNSGFLVLTQANFEDIHKKINEFNGESLKSIKSELGSQWKVISESLGYNLDLGTYEIKSVDQFHAIAFVTPGLVYSDDGDPNDPNKLPSYSGAGALIFSSHRWQALISGNESYIHGGYGSRLPEKTFDTNNIKKLNVVQDANNHFNVKGIKDSGHSPFERHYSERANVIPGESFEETVNGFFKSPQAKKILGNNYRVEDFYKDFVKPAHNPKAPTVSFSNPSVYDVPSYKTIKPDTFVKQPWSADKDKWKDIKGSNPKSEPTPEMRRNFNAQIKDKGHLKAEAHPKHKSVFSTAGDPVDLVTGAFYLNEVDLVINGPFKLELCRNYSSLNSLEGDFGFGWKRNIVGHLDFRIHKNGDETIHAAEDDGTVIVYRKKKSESIFKVYSKDNPTLSNSTTSGIGSLWNKFNSRIEYLKVGDDEQYILYSSDGSERTYKVRAFPIAGLERKRPYLEKWIDKVGNALYFEHGEINEIDKPQYDYGHIKKIYNKIGDWLKFKYNGKGYVTEAYSSDGRRVQYQYDDNTDNLTSVILVDGSVIVYEYDSEHEIHDGRNVVYSKHLIIRENRPEGRVLENMYDAKRRVRIQKASVGQDAKLIANASFEYHKEASDKDPYAEVIVRDANGHPTKHYIYQGKIYKIEDPLGNVILQSWYIDKDRYIDAASGTVKTIPSKELKGYPFALKEEQDKRGLITRYTYDQWGNVITSEVIGKKLTGTDVNAIKNIKTYYIYKDDNPSLLSESYHFGSDKLKRGKRYDYDKVFPFLVSRVEEYVDDVIVSTLEYKYEKIGGIGGALKEEKRSGLSGDTPYVAIYENNSRGKPVQKKELTYTKDPDVVTFYKYNAQGQCFEERDCAGNFIKYHFDSMGRCLSAIHYDKEGKVLKKSHNYYNQNGDITWNQGSMKAPEDITYYHYDYAGRLLAQVKSYFKFDKENNNLVESAKAPYNYGGSITLYEYDILGNQIRKIDPNSHITDMEYDVIGRLTRVYDNESNISYEYEAGGKVSKIKDTSGNETRYEYTLLGWPTKMVNPDGSAIKYSYDVEGRVIQEVHRKDIFIINYNDKKRTEEHIHLQGNTTEIFAYDFRGNVLKHIDETGNMFEYVYDGLGRLIAEKAPESSNSNYSYDPQKSTISITDGVGNKKVLTLDGVGRTIKSDHLNEEGKTVETHEYIYGNNGYQVTESSGNNYYYKSRVFDQHGNVLLEMVYSDYEGGYAFEKIVEYDKKGNPIKILDFNDSETKFKYDPKDRVVEKVLPDGSILRYEYDVQGNLIAMYLPEGIVWKGVFDFKTGNLLTDKLIINGTDNRVFEYTYEDGKLKKLVDPRGIVFDYYYNKPGNLKELRASTGERKLYEYDARGLCTEIVQEGSEGSTKILRKYDGQGKVVEETVFVNDAMHQKTLQGWDSVGCRSILNVLDGEYCHERRYKYNAANRMLSCEVVGTDVSLSYDYRSDGNLSRRKNGLLIKDIKFAQKRDLPSDIYYFMDEVNISRQKTKWTALGKLAKYTYMGRGKGHGFVYKYDEKGRYIEGKLEERSTGNLEYNSEYAYTYNGLDTLTKDAVNDLEIYKVKGRRLVGHQVNSETTIEGLVKDLESSEEKGDETELNNIGEGEINPEELFQGINVASHCSYTYDEIGNVIKIDNSETGIAKKLYWNAWNQLIRVEEGDSIWKAVYDGLGRRVLVNFEDKTKEKRTEIKSYYDPEIEFLEIGLEVNGHKVWKIYGPDMNGEYGALNGVGGLDALIDGKTGKSLRLISDLFGHVIGQVNGDKLTWKEEKVDPYGNVKWEYLEEIEGENEGEDLLKAVGKSIYWRSRRSDITGLVFMGARYYYPESGQFISPDPFGFDGSLDLYNYADGDPINYFDPDGRLFMASYGKVKDFSVKHGRVALDGVQIGLDIAGMAPVLGIVPDMINAGIHTVRGQYVEAGLSLGAVIPIVGDILTGAKLSAKVIDASFQSSKSFTKTADKELKTMGYQRHHIVSDKHHLTRNHELLEKANFDLKSAHNMMYLPSKGGLHSTRSLHRGRHYNNVNEDMAEKMKDIVEKGVAKDWTTKQYNKELMDLLKDTRSRLKQGKIELNSVKR